MSGSGVDVAEHTAFGPLTSAFSVFLVFMRLLRRKAKMTKTIPFDPRSVSPAEWTADMLAKSSEAVTADTPWGTIRGRRAPNGTQVFLSESRAE